MKNKSQFQTPACRQAGALEKKRGGIWCLFIICNLLFGIYPLYAQEETGQEKVQPPPAKTASETETAIIDSLAASQNVTLDFKDADIRNVLKIISYKAAVNIVTTPEVMGNVTIRLVDVPWENALDVILKTYGFAYEKKGNIITVAPIDKLTTQKKQEVELAQVQPTLSEVFNLKYIDAQDARKAIEPQLSARGKITVLEMTGQAGWEFGSAALGKRQRATTEQVGRSKVLIVSDVPPSLDKIREVIEQIDVIPQQVIIETRVVEVNRDKLKDIGFDWGTGASGAESTSITTTPAGKQNGLDTSQVGGRLLSDQITPSVFGPKEGTAVTTLNTGLKVLFKRLTGAQFEVLMHAIDEDVNTNTLSAPRILTLNNQEASILIGSKYPILKTETTGSGSAAVSNITLDYYQDIGIQLNVVPQISAGSNINMVIHPAVSSYTTTVGANAYPIIDIREAETRILMKDGETVVIGGLLKDVKNKEIIGVPFISKIPLLGIFFRRETVDTQKIDLLIFITAAIVKEGDFSADEIAKLEQRLGRGPKDKAAKKKHK